jgi:hypothetical protein
LTATEVADIHRWVHAMVHLQARKGMGVLPEGEWVAECWMQVNPPPRWARDSAAAGEPGSRWCPKINADLVDRVE